MPKLKLPNVHRDEALREVKRSARQGFMVTTITPFHYWAVCGVSRWGNYIRRDKRIVTCGHEHRSERAALKCQRKTRTLRPGNCHDYDVRKMEGLRFRRVRKTLA